MNSTQQGAQLMTGTTPATTTASMTGASSLAPRSRKGRGRKNRVKYTPEQRQQLRTERVEKATTAVLDVFKSGRVPEALAVLCLAGDRPSAKWSVRNQMIAYKIGAHPDARGIQQWREIGRKVKKGERAIYILRPRIHKVEERPIDDPTAEPQEVSKVVGFVPVPVFALTQTEGPNLPEHRAMLNDLPLIELAAEWGIEVLTYPGQGVSWRGSMHSSSDGPKQITLGTASRQTWLHELIHAVESKTGRLEGTLLDKEIVAELGAITLLHVIGYSVEADVGKTYSYIKHHVQEENPKATDAEILAACGKVLDRVYAAVNYVIEAAQALELVNDEFKVSEPNQGIPATSSVPVGTEELGQMSLFDERRNPVPERHPDQPVRPASVLVEPPPMPEPTKLQVDLADRADSKALRLAAQAQEAWQQGHDLVKDVPMGQPFRPGPAGRPLRRRFEQARRLSDKSAQLQQQADAAAWSARGAGRAVLGRDAEAVETLEAQLAHYEAKRSNMKAVNKAYRSGGWDAVGALMQNDVMVRALQREMLTMAKERPYTWELQNLGANIRRLRARIEELVRKAEEGDKEIPFPGGIYQEDAAEDRIRLTFDDRLPKEDYRRVRAEGFRFSRANDAFQRHLNPAGRYAASKVLEMLGYSVVMEDHRIQGIARREA